MIYLASACVKSEKIGDSVRSLAENGYRHIELTGGTNFYSDFKNDLNFIKKKFQLNYLCHNYFPPPKKHFVLNLASTDEVIYQRSLDQLRESLKICRELGARRFGFHAGFFIDIPLSELGGSVTYMKPEQRNHAIERFCKGFEILKQESEGVEIYLENNVFSRTNRENYLNVNPLMLTSFSDYLELKEKIDFKMLTDVGHLKVSAKTLGKTFEEELDKFIKVSDYLHISDNDGLHDLNRCVVEGSEMFSLLTSYDLRKYTMTLEYYEPLASIQEAFHSLQNSLTRKAA